MKERILKYITRKSVVFLFLFCVFVLMLTACNSEPEPQKDSSSSSSYSYILNTSSKVAHKNPGCGAVKQMSEKNKEYSSYIPSGYTKCSNCFH